jgi:hypothetical protein
VQRETSVMQNKRFNYPVSNCGTGLCDEDSLTRKVASLRLLN